MKKVVEISKKDKIRKINEALNCDPVDVELLRFLATTKGGLITDDIRRRAWPKLLNINPFAIDNVKYEIKEHKDYNQVVLDVNRSMRRFPKAMNPKERNVLQSQLTEIILWVLIRNPELNYYQGFHDICVTFLLICGVKSSKLMLDRLSTHHLRDFMDRTMDSTRHILNYLNPIIDKVNEELACFMEKAEVGTIFALSWLITWYGHVLSNPKSVRRLYDLFLSSHPLMPIYLAAQIVIYRSDEVLSSTCDMPTIHHLLSNIPSNLPLEDIISKAVLLYELYPPQSLAKEAALFYDKSLSVLRYKQFELAARNQRPDFVLKSKKVVLKDQIMDQEANKISQTFGINRQGAKWMIYAVTGALGAAAVALSSVAVEWVPEAISYLI